MRTTVTLDPDVDAAVKALMRGEGIGFKEALNQLVRQATRPEQSRPFKTRTRNMGVPTVNLDKALSIAFALDDEETVAKMANDR